MFEFPISLSPIILLTLIVFTLLLRHSLYLYATGSRPRSEVTQHSGKTAEIQHIFLIQNLETTDLLVPFQIQVFSLGNPGRIKSVEIHCGRQGPLDRTFQLEGEERFVLTVHGMAALDTWMVVVHTNDEAEQVRLRLQGWDLRRNASRFWAPTLPQGGITITSRADAVHQVWARPANHVAWMLMIVFLALYLILIHAAGSLKPETNGLWPLNLASEYVKALMPGLRKHPDLWMFGVLAIVFYVAKRLVIDENRWQRLSPGFLGDAFIENRFRRICPALGAPKRSPDTSPSDSAKK